MTEVVRILAGEPRSLAAVSGQQIFWVWLLRWLSPTPTRILFGAAIASLSGSSWAEAEQGNHMSDNRDLSHRQEREQEKEKHAHSTPGKYLSSKHLGFSVIAGVLLIGAAVLVWTFILLPMRAHS